LFVIVPGVLLLFWIGASAFLNGKVSPSILLTKESSGILEVKKIGDESKLVGNIKASDNNFGLVLIGFNVYAKRSSDILTFRIREANSKEWQSSNNYRANWLTPNELFPLGFPVYPNSKGKTYEFEIFSSGDEVVSNGQGIFSGYKFNKTELIENKSALINYVARKAFVNIQNFNFFLSSLLYAVPLIVYIVILISSPLWKEMGLKKEMIALLVGLVLADTFLLRSTYFGIILIISISWIYLSIKTNVTRNIFFYLFFVFVLIWMLGVLTNNHVYEAKLNFWSFFFLCMGVFLTALEAKKSK
jgi:hypothetical protein